MKILAVMVLGLTMVMGCAAEAVDGDGAGSSADAISQKDAYQLAIDAGYFKSGHMSCGRMLTLTATQPHEGSYALKRVPCEGEAGDVIESAGTFKVVGGWLGGFLTNPKMVMTPTHGVSWSFEMKVTDGVVSLTDGEGVLVPEGFLD